VCLYDNKNKQNSIVIDTEIHIQTTVSTTCSCSYKLHRLFDVSIPQYRWIKVGGILLKCITFGSSQLKTVVSPPCLPMPLHFLCYTSRVFLLFRLKVLVADSGRRRLRSASDRTCVVPRTHNRSFSAAGPRV